MAAGVVLQLRITIVERDGDRDPMYVVEGQHTNGKKLSIEVAYADHADLMLHALATGAKLTGLTDDHIAKFLPDHWDEIVMAAKLE